MVSLVSDASEVVARLGGFAEIASPQAAGASVSKEKVPRAGIRGGPRGLGSMSEDHRGDEFEYYGTTLDCVNCMGWGESREFARRFSQISRVALTPVFSAGRKASGFPPRGLHGDGRPLGGLRAGRRTITDDD